MAEKSKDQSIKEKLRQALASTVRAISDDFVVNYNLDNNTKIFFYIENILFYILYTMNLYWYLIIINKAFKIKKD